MCLPSSEILIYLIKVIDLKADVRLTMPVSFHVVASSYNKIDTAGIKLRPIIRLTYFPQADTVFIKIHGPVQFGHRQSNIAYLGGHG